MPFYRFDEMEGRYLTPRLSTAHGPIIEGKTIYFCLNCKKPGEGSVIHYHPNELFIFPTIGKVNSLVGRDRRIVSPGTFIHVPPSGQHQMTATEDGPLNYLYIKDKTWTVVGLSVEEALPDRATSLDEATAEFEKAGWSVGQGEIKKDSGKASVRIEGLGNCYYPIIDTLNAPPSSGNRDYTFEGERMVFGFTERVKAYDTTLQESPHEAFIYVLHGSLYAQVGEQREEVSAGAIVHIPMGSSYRFSTKGTASVRYVSVRSTSKLEGDIARP
jgi:quercetin dioxygenase-like cupin family protein